MEVIKTAWVVVALPMQHHAVRRRSRLFVAHIDVARWTNVMKDAASSSPFPINSPLASQRPSTSWKRRCFVATEQCRRSVTRYDKLAAETLMKELLVGLIAVVCVAD
jgi:hypothetical protein